MSRKINRIKNERKPSTHGTFHIEFKNEAQGLAWAAFKQHDVLFMTGPAGTGKALTMKSNLYTKTGAIKMRDVKIGDEIANPDGFFSKVTGIYPQGKKQICRVHFSDGTYVDCCEEHLWMVSHSEERKNKVVDTKYIEKNCKGDNDKRLLSIKCTKPVSFDRKNYSISPYTMGLLISKGNLNNSASSVNREGKNYANCAVKTRNLNKCKLKKLGIWDTDSSNRFIPKEYLFGSISQRISLLQGLMDGKKRCVSYSTTSNELINDFCQLIYSLGGKAKVKIKEGSLKQKGPVYRASYSWDAKKYIDRVERLHWEEMQCISVDHKDSLYLTDNFTVTHNTHLACAFAIEQILNKERSKIVLTRPIVESGESLGFLPGEFE
jgi:hypothetical protein